MEDMIAEVMIMDLEVTATDTITEATQVMIMVLEVTIMVLEDTKNMTMVLEDMKVTTMELVAAADTTTDQHLPIIIHMVTITVTNTLQSKQKIKMKEILLKLNK